MQQQHAQHARGVQRTVVRAMAFVTSSKTALICGGSAGGVAGAPAAAPPCASAAAACVAPPFRRWPPSVHSGTSQHISSFDSRTMSIACSVRACPSTST